MAPDGFGGDDDFGAHACQHLLHLQPCRADVARQRRRERAIGAFGVERHLSGAVANAISLPAPSVAPDPSVAGAAWPDPTLMARHGATEATRCARVVVAG